MITNDTELIAARDAVAAVRKGLTESTWEQPTVHVDGLMARSLQLTLDLEESLTLAIYHRGVEVKVEITKCQTCGNAMSTDDTGEWYCLNSRCPTRGGAALTAANPEPGHEHERRHGVGDAKCDRCGGVPVVKRMATLGGMLLCNECYTLALNDPESRGPGKY